MGWRLREAVANGVGRAAHRDAAEDDAVAQHAQEVDLVGREPHCAPLLGGAPGLAAAGVGPATNERRGKQGGGGGGGRARVGEMEQWCMMLAAAARDSQRRFRGTDLASPHVPRWKRRSVMLPFDMTYSNLRSAAVVEVGLGRPTDSRCKAPSFTSPSCCGSISFSTISRGTLCLISSSFRRVSAVGGRTSLRIAACSGSQCTQYQEIGTGSCGTGRAVGAAGAATVDGGVGAQIGPIPEFPPVGGGQTGRWTKVFARSVRADSRLHEDMYLEHSQGSPGKRSRCAAHPT